MNDNNQAVNNNQNKKNDNAILIIILVIVGIFVFGLKPIYKKFNKMEGGTKQTPINNNDNKPVEQDVYKIMEPIGTNKLTCKRIVEDENGKATYNLYIYYDSEITSLEEVIIYSGSSEEYVNYIMSEQNKYKYRKNNNTNNGYSVEVQLDGTSYLKVRSVYLLDKISLNNIEVAEGDELGLDIDKSSSINDIIYKLSDKEYGCEK